MDPHCRIGRIRPKAGGIVRLMPHPRAEASAESMAVLEGVVENIDRHFMPESLCGFVVIAWDYGGSYKCYIDSEHSIIPLTLLPSWAGDAIRRRINRDDMSELLFATLGK